MGFSRQEDWSGVPLLYHLGSPKWEITEALRGESFSRHSLSSRPELGLKAHGQWVEWEEPVVEIRSLGSGLHSALDSPRLPSSCEGKLGVALGSLQGRRDLT